MEQISHSVDKKKPKFVPVVKLIRTFHAPVERVWKAWTSPPLIKQWWGPKGYTCPEAKNEFWEGGEYLFAMKDPDGKVIWSGGVYKEILPDQKIVCTDYFANKDGNEVSPEVYGFLGDWDEPLTITVKFERINNDESTILLRHKGIPKKMRDECIKGWNSSIDKLQKLVERI